MVDPSICLCVLGKPWISQQVTCISQFSWLIDSLCLFLNKNRLFEDIQDILGHIPFIVGGHQLIWSLPTGMKEVWFPVRYLQEYSNVDHPGNASPTNVHRAHCGQAVSSPT